MGVSARAAATVCWRGGEPTDPIREQLERAARSLPESDLKSAILATLSERAPTVREALAWVALLQRTDRVRRPG